MTAAANKAQVLLALASEEAAAAAEEQERAEAAAAAEAGAGADGIMADGGDGDGGGRQRIPTPGGVGARGPVSRLQMAKMREDAASRKVAGAQEEVRVQGELVAKLGVARAEAVMAVSGWLVVEGGVVGVVVFLVGACGVVELVCQNLYSSCSRQAVRHGGALPSC